MSKKIALTANSFLNYLSKEDVSEAFEVMNMLIEEIENKNDPEPMELQVLDQMYKTLEQWKLMENNVRNYIKSLNKKSSGELLNSLYEEEENDIYFRGLTR